MCNAGKNTQEHPGDAVFQKYVSVIRRRCGQDPHTRLCEEGCSLGNERKSWVSLEICLILPPPHSSTPLFLSTSSSPLFMFEVTRHKPEMGTGVSEAECVGLCWKWRAVIPAHAFGIWRYTASSAYALCGFQGDDSSRQGSPLLFFLMPSIYSAKCERQEGRSISS